MAAKTRAETLARDSRSFSALDDDWDVKDAGTYSSRPSEGQSFQRLIFNEPFRDGAVATDVIIRKGIKSEKEGEGKTAAVIVRYKDPKNYYYAGLGGHGGRFFIARWRNGDGEVFDTVGKTDSIHLNQPYRIEVTCVRDRITLSHNNVHQLSVRDASFDSGLWGFHTWKTFAEFSDISTRVVQPNCFVIMPFAAEFDSVYQVIRETVENHGFECVRADERYISGPIMDDVAERIEQADLIVADFTNRNPNVFYEAGFAAALRKPVIYIAQSVSDLPFDVRHLRVFSYNTNYLGDRKLAYDLGESIKATTGFGEVQSRRMAIPV